MIEKLDDTKLMKIKYPRYSREQKLSCKLTDDDICQIKKLYYRRHTQTYIARLFNVARTTVGRWINLEHTDRLAKIRLKDNPPKRSASNLISCAKSKRRKRKLQPIEISLMDKVYFKNAYLLHKEYMLERSRRYYLLNREKILEKQKLKRR